jgi:hypothetical protein
LNRRKLALVCAFTLILTTLVFVSVQVQTIQALVPSIVSVEHYDVGSVTWLNITINHTPPPAIGPSHYVSNVQVEVNGTTQNLSQSPQSTETFSVQYSLGPNSNTYLVRARALCTVHGYSAFSSTVSVPEISLTTVILFITVATVTTVIVRSTLRRHKNTIRCSKYLLQ